MKQIQSSLAKYSEKSLEKKLNNYFEIVENAFREILACGLAPFVKREMNARYGEDWVTNGKVSIQSYHLNKGELNWSDMQAVLKLIINQWNDLFKQKLGYSARGYVSELIEVRNNLKHESRDTFDFDYSHRALDSIERLLSTFPNDRIAESKAKEAAEKKKELHSTLTISTVQESDKKAESSSLPWHDICGVMLLQKQRDSLRRKATEIGAEVNVYVSLDLLHREERSRNDSLSNERVDKKPVSEVDKKPVSEIDKTFKHDDFLESLTQRQSKNKHIAIVGEAGAGKTTLLVRIAEELHKQGQLSIFISLADLQDKSLYDYIYESWLAGALGKRKGSATEQQKNDLFEQFKAGKIWLLLDGLDEMQSKSSTDALHRIKREIEDVIEPSRVILTCRLNVWDRQLNGLSNFDTFIMGSFSPEQVDEFISDWFVSAERPESGTILKAKLKEPNRDRIWDMVRHPLRLALLCQAFYRNPDAELPETKADLYELFVRYFYEWKPNIIDIDLNDSLKDELHQALGKLAIAGIDGDEGFRLSRSLAVKQMGDRLFKLACNLGWINLVDRNEREQEVYSFFHATFQEYFAALAINNREFFLNHVPNNPSCGNYRVFNQSWKQVLLLWIGRSEGSLLQERKLLIQDFDDFLRSCNNEFVLNKNLNLLLECTSEFNEFGYAYQIIYTHLEDTLEDAYGWWDEDKCKWVESPREVCQKAIELLKLTNKRILSNLVIGIYNKVVDIRININNYKVLDVSRKLSLEADLYNIELNLTIMMAFLGSSDKVIDRLIWWLEDSPIHAIQSNILSAIEKVCIGNERAIHALTNIFFISSESTDQYYDEGMSLLSEPINYVYLFNILVRKSVVSRISIPKFRKIDPDAIERAAAIMRGNKKRVMETTVPKSENVEIISSPLDDLHSYLCYFSSLDDLYSDLCCSPSYSDGFALYLNDIKKSLNTIDTLGISQVFILNKYKSQMKNNPAASSGVSNLKEQ